MPRALLIAVALVPAPASFAPPLEVPLAYVATESRDDAGIARHFRSERRLVFRRAGDGFVADVTLTRSESSADGDIGSMFAAALGTIEGRTVRIHLDARGAVVSVEDRDALWERLCTAIAAMAPSAKAKHAAALAAALRALAPEARTAMLGSLVAPLIAGEEESALVPGSETASVIRTRPPAGGAIAVPATRRVSAADGGLIEVRTHGEAEIPAAGGGTAHLVIDRTRSIDPRTRLVRRTEETRRIALDSGAVTTAHTVVALAEVL